MQDKKTESEFESNVEPVRVGQNIWALCCPRESWKTTPSLSLSRSRAGCNFLNFFYIFHTQVLTAALFQPAITYQTAVVMDCVWITMFANVIKDGLGITVHNSLVRTWITVQVTCLLVYIINENFSLGFNLVHKYHSNFSAKKGCLFTMR